MEYKKLYKGLAGVLVGSVMLSSCAPSLSTTYNKRSLNEYVEKTKQYITTNIKKEIESWERYNNKACEYESKIYPRRIEIYTLNGKLKEQYSDTIYGKKEIDSFMKVLGENYEFMKGKNIPEPKKIYACERAIVEEEVNKLLNTKELYYGVVFVAPRGVLMHLTKEPYSSKGLTEISILKEGEKKGIVYVFTDEGSINRIRESTKIGSDIIAYGIGAGVYAAITSLNIPVSMLLGGFVGSVKSGFEEKTKIEESKSKDIIVDKIVVQKPTYNKIMDIYTFYKTITNKDIPLDKMVVVRGKDDIYISLGELEVVYKNNQIGFGSLAKDHNLKPEEKIILSAIVGGLTGLAVKETKDVEKSYYKGERRSENLLDNGGGSDQNTNVY